MADHDSSFIATGGTIAQVLRQGGIAGVYVDFTLPASGAKTVTVRADQPLLGAPAGRAAGLDLSVAPNPFPAVAGTRVTIRFALPGYANVWQVLVKSTAVVSVIGLEDLVGLADSAGKTARQPFVFFAAVLLAYLVFTWISTQVFAWMERRYALKGHHAR